MKASKKKEKKKRGKEDSLRAPQTSPPKPGSAKLFPQGLFQFTNGGWEEVLPEETLPRRRK